MNNIKLKILGANSPFCLKNQACPSYYITDGESKILLDCGSGSHRFFNMEELNGLNIFISHLHRDHYNDIFNYQYTSFVYHNSNKIKDHLSIFLPEFNSAISKDLRVEKNAYAKYFKIEEKQIYNIGKFKVEFCEIAHSTQVRNYAIKISNDDYIIVYTGDMSYIAKDKLIKFAKDVDLLICESSLLKEHKFPEICSHLTAFQAGEIAREAGVTRLMLTHFWPLESQEKYLLEAQENFGKVIIAEEGLELKLYSDREEYLD